VAAFEAGTSFLNEYQRNKEFYSITSSKRIILALGFNVALVLFIPRIDFHIFGSRMFLKPIDTRAAKIIGRPIGIIRRAKVHHAEATVKKMASLTSESNFIFSIRIGTTRTNANVHKS
jgi:hypothetical protein